MKTIITVACLGIALSVARNCGGAGEEGPGVRLPDPVIIDWAQPKRTTEIAIRGSVAEVRTCAPDGRFLVGWRARVTRLADGSVRIDSSEAKPSGPLAGDYDPDNFVLWESGKVEISDRRGRRHLALMRATGPTGQREGVESDDRQMWAIELVRKALVENRAYPPDQMRVLMFFTEALEDGTTDVEVRWNNSKIPGADPNVAPMAAMFHVLRDRKTIEWLDVLEGDYRPFENFLKRQREQ